MRKLRPEIVQLMILAKAAPDEGNDHAPFGFATRVLAACRLAARREVLRLQRTFSIASWAATLVIVSCGGALLGWERGAQPAGQLKAAAHYLAETLSP